MLAHECLLHPWLKTSTISSTQQPQIEERIINTKNLRRFVIRRRWQVKNNLISKKKTKLFEFQFI